MKRTPLRRKTPMKTGSTLNRSGKLSPVSKKRKAALQIYYRKRIEYLRLHPNCEAGPILANVPNTHKCEGHASQIHHTMRRGPWLNVTSTWLAVCPNCHRFIETHANIARELKLIRT